MSVHAFAARSALELRRSFGGELRRVDDGATFAGMAEPAEGVLLGEGVLCPVFTPRFAQRLPPSVACVLCTEDMAARSELAAMPLWIHRHAPWVMAELLRACTTPLPDAVVHPSATVASTAVLAPGVVIGARARIGAYAVIGEAGFGWAHSPEGRVVHIPHRGGVVVGEDVYVGPHCTIDSGVLRPTRIGPRARLDAHVHVGHNGDIGADAVLCAQTGLAGSVTLGVGAVLGGQVGVRDHVTIGAGARVGGKAGVIGDVAAGAVVAGYPAVARGTWLRAASAMYRRAAGPVRGRS